MRPIEIPAGTTVESLITEVLPSEHKRLVTPGTSGEIVAVLRVDGAASWTIRGRDLELKIEPGESKERGLWIASDRATVETILEDAEGPGELLPDVPAGTPFIALSDPRVWTRMAMVEGSIHASVDYRGKRLWVAFGGGRRAKTIDVEKTDVKVEVPYALFKKLLDGKTRPEEALTDHSINLTGSRLVAMQAALATALLYPGAPKR